MKKIILIILVMIAAGVSIAQTSQGDQRVFDGLMRSNGRIYVVIAVILIIWTGLFIYLIRIDKKIRELDKHITE